MLADSLYGESGTNFVDVLYELKLNFVVAIRSNHAVWVVAIRSNHAVWLPQEQKVRANRWRKFERVFTDGNKQVRYIREIIFGKRRSQQFWQVTTDIEKLPSNSTWYLMTQVPGIRYQEVGNIYGIRTWVEFGLKQSKNELGWADFRVTDYAQIEKWWEIVCSTYLLVSLHSEQFNQFLTSVPDKLQKHEQWNFDDSWKSLLNNLRLILQPWTSFNLTKRWLKVFPIPQLSLGFPRLISIMNQFDCLKFLHHLFDDFYFSSA